MTSNFGDTEIIVLLFRSKTASVFCVVYGLKIVHIRHVGSFVKFAELYVMTVSTSTSAIRWRRGKGRENETL